MTSATPKRFSHWATSLAASLLSKWRKVRQGSSPAGNPEGYPLGLEAQEVQALRHLLQSPQWPSYSALLERATLANVERLLTALPHDEYLFYCGVVYACRRVSDLPELVLAKASQLEEHRNARERASAAEPGAEGASFLNTPWWDSFVRDAVSRRTNGNTSGTDLNALG